MKYIEQLQQSFVSLKLSYLLLFTMENKKRSWLILKRICRKDQILRKIVD